MWKHGRTIYSLTRCVTDNLSVFVDSANSTNVNLQQVRHIRKHWDPKFKRLRRDKVVPVPKEDILMYQSRFSDEITPELQRTRLLRLNIPLNMDSPPINIHNSSTNFIWSPYNPSEGDGKYSLVDKAQDKLSGIKVTTKSFLHLRKIRSLDVNFNKKSFPQEALEIYTKAHEILASGNREDLIQYVTTAVYTTMMHNIEKKTIRWKLLKVLDPPTIVQADISKSHDAAMFAQITVRLHTEQMLAVYDRFGRLMQGSEILRKDVLEYVVFEKAMGERNAIWRIVGKIGPKSGIPGDPIEKTYVQSRVKIEENPPVSQL